MISSKKSTNFIPDELREKYQLLSEEQKERAGLLGLIILNERGYQK